MIPQSAGTCYSYFNLGFTYPLGFSLYWRAESVFHW
uniref:Uncharacterized protein n=1 Tax=Anguilla anguilla TaxID=7936 RepID=A0A0E9UVU6_ANGAN